MCKDLDVDLDVLKFGADGLIPAIAVNYETGHVLMLAYMNRKSLEMTLTTRVVHYYSRSHMNIWKKGETSGHVQSVKEVWIDCDLDTILLKVEQVGAACHMGYESCFFRRLDDKNALKPKVPQVFDPSKVYIRDIKAHIADKVFTVVLDRRSKDPKESYVSSLFSKGLPKIEEKVIEEANELIKAARLEGKKEIVHEAADVFFHVFVLLAYLGVGLNDVWGELESRFGISGHEEKRRRNAK